MLLDTLELAHTSPFPHARRRWRRRAPTTSARTFRTWWLPRPRSRSARQRSGRRTRTARSRRASSSEPVGARLHCSCIGRGRGEMGSSLERAGQGGGGGGALLPPKVWQKCRWCWRAGPNGQAARALCAVRSLCCVAPAVLRGRGCQELLVGQSSEIDRNGSWRADGSTALVTRCSSQRLAWSKPRRLHR